MNGIMYGREVELGQTAKLYGSTVVTEVGNFKNSSTVTFDPSKFPAVWPPGLSGSSTIESQVTIVNWKENF
jgi:hypothetical protein